MLSFLPIAPVFWAGYFFNKLFFWLPWVGFLRLCFLYQTRRYGNFWKDFLLPSWVVFLAVCAVCFHWIFLHDPWVYGLGVLIFSLVFPLFFLLHHLLTSKFHSPVLETLAAFGIFLVLEFSMSRVPALESAGLDLFFQPPAAVLCVLKFINFKVWSAWVFATCFAIACLAREKKTGTIMLAGVLAAGIVALVTVAHVQNMFSGKRTGPTVKVALVQPGFPYSEAWRSAHLAEIKKKYFELAVKAARGDPDLIVFPLYTLPGDVYREPDFLEKLARLAKHPVLVAAHVPIQPGDKTFAQGFMNLAFLYAPDGKLKDIYQAVEALPFLYLNVKKAEKYRVVHGPFGKLGVLLCYEDMIPRLSAEAVRSGARALVVLSNPGLFKKTPMLYYQFFQDQIRAAETGLPLIRVASEGYSALIDRTGTLVQKTRLDREEILQVELSGLGPLDAGGEETRNPLLEEPQGLPS